MSVLDGGYGSEGYAVAFGHFGAEVARSWFLFEEESAGGYGVAERECGDGERAVLEDDGVACGVDGVEAEVEGEVAGEELYLGAEEGFEVGVSMDGEGSVASEESHGGDEGEEAEAVVAVEV